MILIPFLLIILLYVIGYVTTIFVENYPEQKKFVEGKIPKSLQGFYSGMTNSKKGWQGKKFNNEDSTGINILSNGKDRFEKYPFKTYSGKGIRDKKTDVLKIDYGIAKNPFYIKMILDELVEVSKDKYLGKVNIKVWPGFVFCVGFFRLEKDAV